MDFMFDFEAEGDRFSFEDSERFDEESICSWISEPESLCNNWRGWRRQNGGNQPQTCYSSEDRRVTSLVELAAQAVACHIPFEVVEHFYPPIPEQLQLRIAFWSFAENEEDIRLYSCLANGSADEFQKGEHLFKAGAVKDALQIGFHLSATVVPGQTLPQAKGYLPYNVAVVFDRRRITSCTCTCNSQASWCAHVVALCLFRIHQASSVCLRAPVSESLSRLHRDQLQKFAQYLISELPQQILPTAQRLLDELLSTQQNAINTVCGAPDPTAGPSASELTTWCLDEVTLHFNMKKTLAKFCVPAPIVFSDVNYLSSTAPPAATEWLSLLRPLRGREPEGIWNLLSIVREMYRRNDSNAIPLLEILTEEVLACEQILVWWFTTKISSSHNSNSCYGRSPNQNNSSSSPQAATSLCDEIVTLGRLAALNPALSPIQRDDLCQRLKEWHILTIDKVRKARTSNVNIIKKVDIECFSGFKPAIEACQLDWSDYVITGVTYVERHRPRWRLPYVKAQESECRKSSRTKGVITSSQVSCGGLRSAESMFACRAPHRHALVHKSQEYTMKVSDLQASAGQTDGAYSSSSEGFCESDRRDSAGKHQDSDSDLGDIEVINDRKNFPESSKKKPERPGIVKASTKIVVKNEEPDSDGSLPEAADFRAKKLPECHNSVKAASAEPAGAAAKLHKEDQWEGHLSSDEFQVYYYDTKAKLPEPQPEKKKKVDEPNYFAGIKKIENKQEILFARAEALHAHGHTKHACKLAKQLAEEMLANPPDLNTEQAAPPAKGKKKKAQNNISSFASTTLAKAAFLCNVLLEEPECHHLAFRVGMFGLEMPRPPASSKALEVKLAYQESELVTLLKKIPLGPAELNVIRDRGEKLRDGKLKSRGEALLPLSLSGFIFDSLNSLACSTSRPGPNGKQVPHPGKLATDEKLGFDAAVAALGLKANISEADHPLLCEGTRRQRGELAIAMLVQYKDDPSKLSKVMEKVLDKEVHQLYKAPSSLATYLTNSSAARSKASIANHRTGTTTSISELAPVSNNVHRKSPSSGCESDDGLGMPEDTTCSSSGTLVSTTSMSDIQNPPTVGTTCTNGSAWKDSDMNADERVERLEYLNLEGKIMNLHVSNGARPKTTLLTRYNSKDTDSSALEEEGEASSDYKAWEAKFRCTNLKTAKKHSVGMAAIDSSAPETTSSDNSPTVVRRSWPKHQGPGSDSGSSGKSSDSLGSSSSGDKGHAAKIRDNESPPGESRYPHLLLYSRSSTPSIKGVRYKGKSRIIPTIPNQPSEAQAHFMFEQAKTVLTKAGGNSSTSLFTQPTTTTSHSGPHRALHLCAFQIGLYALGLHNCVSPNWLSRTYSSHVSWITGQAMEIGSSAINILIDTWEGHLTPQEVASLADRASRGRDPNIVKAAAELALSCLPHAQALNPSEIQRALIQCKEQSRDMLERACLVVENAAKDGPGGVYPEVLFDVAKRWYELYEELMQAANGQTSQAGGTAGDVSADNGHAIASACPLSEATSPSLVQLVPAQPGVQTAAAVVAAAAMPLQAAHVPGQAHGQLVAVSPMSYTVPPPNSHSQMPHHPYIAPYSYVQQVPPNFAHHYSAPHIPLHTHNMHPSYMATYPYQNQTPFAGVTHIQSTATLYHANVSHLRPPPATPVQIAYTGHTAQLANIHGRPALIQPAKFATMQQGESQVVPNQAAVLIQQSPVVTAGQQQQPPPQPQPENMPVQNSTQMNYLTAAYRVGMLAMEALAKRVHDDRPQTKYARNPPYGEDVKWLLNVAMQLGTNYLQQFCASAVNAVVSPFILHDIAIEAAHYLSRNNPAQVSQQLRSPSLNSLVQKCLQMFIQCTHQRVHHITQAEYDEFVSIVCCARNAFCMTQGGMVQFNELLQSLRRSKSCKKELWQRIVNGLATGSI